VRAVLDPGLIARLAVAVAAGAAAVAVASGVDPLSARIALQAAAVLCAALMAWRTGVGTDVAPAEPVAPMTNAVLSGMIADRRRPVFDRDTGLCANWYFRLRVEEEMARAARYGQPFTVIRISSSSRQSLETCRISVKKWLRAVDFAGDFGDAIAVMLPNTDRPGATVVVERVSSLVSGLDFRLSQYPVDAATVSHLLGEDEWHVGEDAALSV